MGGALHPWNGEGPPVALHGREALPPGALEPGGVEAPDGYRCARQTAGTFTRAVDFPVG